MLLEKNIYSIPKWSKDNDINRWCDYIELRCIISLDCLVSKDEIIDILSSDMDEKGGEDYSKQFDRIVYQVELMFEQIAYRYNTFPVFYPFKYDGECLYIKSTLDVYNLQYLVLLICSSIAFLDNSSRLKVTEYFEEYCLKVFRHLVASDSEIYLFGTSRKGNMFTGTLRKRIEKLAKCFGANTTKTFDNDTRLDVPAGDAGLDLVAYNKLDNSTHIPIALGQCTCSYTKWEIKQEDINREKWKQKIEPLPPFQEYMFVSFFCRDAGGKFEKPTTITTCLIDRQRILKVLDLHKQEIGDNDCTVQMELLEECCGKEFKAKIISVLSI